MKIQVYAKTRAGKDRVELLQQTKLALDPQQTKLPIYKVSVKEMPMAGKANKAIIQALAKHFDVPISSVTLLSGHSSKQKIFEIMLSDHEDKNQMISSRIKLT